MMTINSTIFQLMASGMLVGFTLLHSQICFAVAPTESQIESVVVNYSTGDSIEIKCRVDDCSVNVRVRGRKFSFMSDDLSGNPLAEQPIMYPNLLTPVQFSFDIRLDCETSGFAPSTLGYCVGNYQVQDGKISNVIKWSVFHGEVIPASSVAKPPR